jgi:threonine/homoserine/homoserine lactone efflux protein
MAVALVSDSAYAYAAGTARDWFSGSPRRLARMQGTGGLMMIGLGGSLALTGQK